MDMPFRFREGGHHHPDAPREAPVQSRPLSRRRAVGTIAAAVAGAAGTTLIPGSATAAPATAGSASPPELLFHVIGDPHIKREEPRQIRHMVAGMSDLRVTAPEADALVVNGDLTDHGRPEDYLLFGALATSSPHPEHTFYTIGNHEYHTDEDPAVLRQRYLDFVGMSTVYYTRVVNGYRFVFLGMEDIVPSEQNPPTSRPHTAVLSQTQLDWLARTLADNPPPKPVFLFLHHPPEEVQQRAAFEEILRRHPNVVYIWSHWHTDLRWYRYGPDPRLFGRENGYWRVHSGACAYVLQYEHVDGTVRQTTQWDWAQGIQVEVYDDRILVRGRDLRTRQWIPEFQNTIPLPLA